MKIKFLVYKVEDGELIPDAFFDSKEQADWKVRYLAGEEGTRVGEESLGDYEVIEVISHGD